jgi:hypothetical protein
MGFAQCPTCHGEGVINTSDLVPSVKGGNRK